MTRRARAWVAAGIATLLTGTLLIGVGTVPGVAADDGDICSGMSADQEVRAGNRPPTPADDRIAALAGGTRTIRVLANDTDPDGDDLAVVSVTQPPRGEVCVDSDGRIEYFGVSSATGYTDRFRYGVTDGDLYRTATVTVTVQGIAPLRTTVVKRKKRKPARVYFTNPNRRNLAVLAGDPRRKRAQLSRTITPGKTVVLRTRSKRVVFYALTNDYDGYPIVVSVGAINTRTGRQYVQSGDGALLRQQRVVPQNLRSLQRSWMGER